MTLEEFVSKLEGQKNWSNGNYQCRCPAHEDRVQSLSVSELEDRILVYCHAGCNYSDICYAMGIQVADLWKDTTSQEHLVPYWQQQPEKVWNYLNIDGTVAFQEVRFPGKVIRFRRFSDGKIIWNLDGVKRIPYRLPELVELHKYTELPYGDNYPGSIPMATVFVTEGPKDADRIVEEEKNATCFPLGAGRGKFLARYVKYFLGLNVVIIADKDEPGLEYAREIKDALTGVAASVKIVQAAVGKDVSDHLDAGKTLDELEEVE